jgi:hypothetical protein
MVQSVSSSADSAPERVKTPAGKPPRRLLRWSLTLAALALMSFYVQGQARNLWNECSLLIGEIRESQRSTVVGFLNIAPVTTFAAPPARWYRDEGDKSLLWSGWQDGHGHRWYSFPRGEIDPARLCRPTSDFASRAIDFPLTETDGGTIWKRIHSDAMVAGQVLEGQRCVYPLAVLVKVEVVNDIVREHPFLVVVNLLDPHQAEVSVFEATLQGRRLTMAATGYFQDQKPLLFDRGTESLWVEQGDALRAVAGKYKGVSLDLVARPVPVSWSTWQTRNRQCRLLVGADRSHGVPRE